MHDCNIRYSIVNLGCKVNRVESDSFSEFMAKRGCIESSVSDADVIIVNTCTVTSEADRKTRKAIHRVIRENPIARILVTGCASAIDPSFYSEMDSRIKVVLKADVIEELDGIVPDVSLAHETVFMPSRARVGIKVQDGCDNACTYCIVHTARGKSRSVPRDAVIDGFLRLLDAGVREILLTGINIGSYKYRDGTKTYDIAMLLEALMYAARGMDSYRIRISSIEPNDLGDDLIDLMASADGKICRHLHLPLQSGSTDVLREMDRPYSAEEFASLIAKIRKAIPSISLTTDVISGFPGESDSDHTRTLELSERCGFSKMHVFPYSKRDNTPAAARADQVAFEVKSRRAAELRALSSRLREKDLVSRAGTIEAAVVEIPGRACTESYHEVEVDPSLEVGSLVDYRFNVQLTHV